MKPGYSAKRTHNHRRANQVPNNIAYRCLKLDGCGLVQICLIQFLLDAIHISGSKIYTADNWLSSLLLDKQLIPVEHLLSCLPYISKLLLMKLTLFLCVQFHQNIYFNTSKYTCTFQAPLFLYLLLRSCKDTVHRQDKRRLIGKSECISGSYPRLQNTSRPI